MGGSPMTYPKAAMPSIFAAFFFVVGGCASAEHALDGLDTSDSALRGERHDGRGDGRACGARAGNTCGEREFCNYRPGAFCGQSDQAATCVRKPRFCEPNRGRNGVCGCDGLTYPSSCAANIQGIGVLSAGPCAVTSECPSGEKKCFSCGAPPPDGVCRSYICVAPNAACPLFP
jgi:hypothetical protein